MVTPTLREPNQIVDLMTQSNEMFQTSPTIWKKHMQIQIQIQPNKWSCLPTAFAMAIDVPVAKVIEDICHDGSKIIFPEYDDPFCRRSFHIQELTDICLKRGFAVVPIENQPISEAKNHQYNVPVHNKRLEYYLVNYTGVLIGMIQTDRPHAVAWNGHRILDPNGTDYNVIDFRIDIFFLIIKFNITKQTKFLSN